MEISYNLNKKTFTHKIEINDFTFFLIYEPESPSWLLVDFLGLLAFESLVSKKTLDETFKILSKELDKNQSLFIQGNILLKEFESQIGLPQPIKELSLKERICFSVIQLLISELNDKKFGIPKQKSEMNQFFLIIAPTRACHYHCLDCIERENINETEGELEMDFFTNFINDSCKYLKNKHQDNFSLNVSFDAAEPLLKPKLEKSIISLKEIWEDKINFHIKTTAVLIDKLISLLPYLKRIDFSIDGLPEVDSIIRNPRNFQTIINALRILKEKNFKNVSLNTVLRPENYLHLKENYHKLVESIESEFPEISLNLSPFVAPKILKEQRYLPQNIEKDIIALKAKKKLEPKKAIHIFFKSIKEKADFAKEKASKGICEISPFIGYNGNVYFCYYGKKLIGNIKDLKIEEIFEKITLLKKTHHIKNQENEPCFSCLHKNYCCSAIGCPASLHFKCNFEKKEKLITDLISATYLFVLLINSLFENKDYTTKIKITYP